MRRATVFSAVAVFAAVSALAAACSSRAVLVVPDLPPDLRWMALAFHGPGGWSITPLTRFEAAVDLSLAHVPSDANQLTLAAFSERDFEAATASVSMDRVARPLLPPDSPNLRMVPTFSATGLLGEDVVTLARDDPPQVFTNDWRPCPTLVSAPAVVDLPCFGHACQATAVQQGCVLALRSEDTCAGTFDALVEPSGGINANSGTVLGSCRRDSGNGERVHLRCEGSTVLAGDVCQMEVLPAAGEPQPGYRVDEVDLAHGAPPAPGTYPWRYSYVRGLVQGRSGLLTAVSGTPTAYACAGAAFELAEIDPEAMVITATRTLPPCVRLLDAANGELVAIWGETSLTMGRLTESGAIVAEQVVEGVLGGGAWIPEMSLVDHLAGALVVLFASSSPELQHRERKLGVFDVGTLVRRGAPVDLSNSTHALVRHPDGSIYVLNGTYLAQAIDVRTGTLAPRPTIAIFDRCRRHVEGARGLFLAQNGDLLITARKETEELLWIPAGGESCTNAVVAELLGAPFALAQWPADPDLLLVSVDGMTDFIGRAPIESTELAFFSFSKRRFLLGARHVGTRPLTSFTQVGRDLFGLIGGEGRLIRVRPE
ncbi:MAG: hypothetical protein IT384_06580 [Deltaproteobacteria bacterium]|nr:hypothetical protein [Deltaproteobacteria bacterium]